MISGILAALTATATAPAIDPGKAPGAWASAETAAACATAPISMFFADGSVAVFESAAGGLHAVGVWKIENDKLVMTHNDAPFPMDGAGKPASSLTIEELSDARFVTANAEGKRRVRVRCQGVVLPHGAKESAH